MGVPVGSALAMRQIGTPAGNPPAGETLLYVKPDGKVYLKDSSGVETQIGSTGSSRPATGVVEAFAGSVAPDGAVLCQGQELSRTGYAALFAVIGTTYGAGDGSTTFNAPDARDRQIVGASATKALGSTGGAASSQIMLANVPGHQHGIGHSHAVDHTHDLSSHTHSLQAHTHTLSSHVHSMTHDHDMTHNHLISSRESGPGPQNNHVMNSGGIGTLHEDNAANYSYSGTTGLNNQPSTSGPNNNTSGGPSTASSGAPSTNATGASSAASTGAQTGTSSDSAGLSAEGSTTPLPTQDPYLAMNMIIWT